MSAVRSAKAARPADAASPEALPAALGRNAPLVPIDSAESRALVGVIAILAFLAALCACAAELVGAASAQWQSSVGREMTIQIRPVSGRDVDADVARVVELARGAAGIAGAEAMGKAEAERLLEPWLGSGLDLSDLPVPRLIVLRLDSGAPVDADALRRRIAEVPSATLDDHGLWLARLSIMARAVVGAAVAIVLLVFVATGLAVAFATRGAVAGNREVVDVLHFVGADDAFIAREFQRRFFRLGLKGGVIGGGAALVLVAACGFLLSAWRGSATRDQVEALFGAFALGWRGYASVVAVAAIASFMTGTVTRLTVRRILRRLSGRPRPA